MGQKVIIFDTTLRDGEQSPGCSMNLREKLALAHQLDNLGVDVVEAGFPVASEGDFAAVQQIAREVRRPSVAALARAKREDIERAWSALEHAERPRIHTFLATSDIHLQYKLKISREAALEQAAEAVSFARSLCADVEFSPEDATRSDVDFLCRVLDAVIEAGATTINIPDTVGFMLPAEFAALITTIRERVAGASRAIISIHCHDDLGLAVANSLAGLEAGARQVECTINGIGERAGNAALEEVVMAMRVRAEHLPYSTSVRPEELCPTSRLLASMIAFGPQPNKAIVGSNAFAHEAGIHQHGVLSNPLCYEIITPESVGAGATQMVLGKHSGRSALAQRLTDLGCSTSKAELDAVYGQFISLADRKKKIYDQDLLAIITNVRRQGQPPAVTASVAHGLRH